ncbi:MAG: asparaginase, partial [Acetobacteraceae bacterium]|nr:asparaginase [Acetobacteraceae bacterium]
MKPVVAFIGTGGTISSLGKDSLDVVDYAAQGVMLHADQILARFPELRQVATVIPVPYRNVPSFDIFYPQWRELVLL